MEIEAAPGSHNQVTRVLSVAGLVFALVSPAYAAEIFAMTGVCNYAST